MKPRMNTDSHGWGGQLLRAQGTPTPGSYLKTCASDRKLNGLGGKISCANAQNSAEEIENKGFK